MTTIVNAKIFTHLKHKTLTVVASSVQGRLTTKTGSTYNSFDLCVKCSDGNIYNLAKGFIQYGYGREYEYRAKKVLSLIDPSLQIDFISSENVKNKDMPNIKHYSDDLKSGWYVDIIELVK